jgi:surface antigen
MADNWGYSARACGFVVDAEPAAGAVIVFPPWANGASPRGHVGYVEEVGSDYVLISECNADYNSLYAEEPFWSEAGYPCIHRRIPRYSLDPGIEYIHGRAEVPVP